MLSNNQWGPPAWYFLHAITLNYPKNPTYNDKMNYMNFFKSIGYVLPCPKCGMNYNKNIQENPIDNHLNSREDLIQWLINIHNNVNIELNKPSYYYNDMMYFLNNSKLYTFNTSLMIIIFVIVIVTSSNIYKKYK